MAETNRTKQEDLKLAKRILAGSTEAFEEFYNHTHKDIYSLCYKRLRNESLAEDICQEVYIQAWRKMSTYKGDALLSTWLFRIAVNQVGMYFRRCVVRKEGQSIEDSAPEICIAMRKHSTTSEVLRQLELLAATEQLANGYKRFWWLVDVEGFTHTEAAKLMGCTEGTSKSQVFKARQKLRSLLLKKANPALVQT